MSVIAALQKKCASFNDFSGFADMLHYYCIYRPPRTNNGLKQKSIKGGFKCRSRLKTKSYESKSSSISALSDCGHFIQMWGFPAACAQLVHPQRRFVLQRGATGVKSEGSVIVQEAAERGHVQV